MYTLDFNTIKLMMQSYQQTGLLTAEVASGVAGLRGPCRIEIALNAGSIVMCTLIGSDGAWLTGKEAEQALTHLGRLRWTFTMQPEVVALPKPAIPVVETNFIIPWRIASVSSEQLRTWPRTHRLIFAVADGTKNVAKIAEVLSISPDFVKKALSDLQLIGVIAFGRQDGNDRS